tara:strand:+ start:219 stop:2366 length:2148 start_codon:yes stop_codon:yes gene_type:complete
MIAVSLYIKNLKYSNLTEATVNAFQKRVETDGGVFEDRNGMLDDLNALGGVYGYSNVYDRVDLFSDEKLSIVSSIQNVNDISKVFSDYTYTFTIPASNVNNKIFKHWYENSIDNAFSTLVKADAYIEVDTIPFKVGKIQLQDCTMENGRPKNYSLIFFGSIGSLKDSFAGLFLRDLTAQDYDFNYTANLVRDKVTTQSLDYTFLAFPLISSNRYWNYGGGSPNDVSVPAQAIRYNELFPALKVSAIFNMIAQQFDITFNGSFLTDARFTSAYLWLKNSETFDSIGQSLKINYQSQSATNDTGINFNTTTDVLTFGSLTATKLDAKRFIYLNITFNEDLVKYYLYVYKNGVKITTISDTTIIGEKTSLVFRYDGNLSSSDEYEFYIASASPLTFTSTATLTLLYKLAGSGVIYDEEATLFQTTSQTTSALLSIAEYMPNIKIEDFFSGVLKMFNLTAYSENGIDFTLEQIENYYNNGTIRDITQYIKSENESLKRVETYKKINFEYEKSESLVNVGFKSANGVEYGSLLYDTDNDGQEYSIKLPFENLNFNNLQNELQVGYVLKQDLKSYIPKPIILYDYNPDSVLELTGDTHYHFATTLSGSGLEYLEYKAFGQEVLISGETYSLNFPAQQSTLTNNFITNSLYSEYYETYFANIFDYKARLVNVEGIIPTSLITSLKLNDRIIIRDKRYLINTMTTDLTTGEVKFELLTDNRVL